MLLKLIDFWIFFKWINPNQIICC